MVALLAQFASQRIVDFLLGFFILLLIGDGVFQSLYLGLKGFDLRQKFRHLRNGFLAFLSGIEEVDTVQRGCQLL